MMSEVVSSRVYLKHHLFLPLHPPSSSSCFSDPHSPERGKKLVFLTARVHPGESPASFICQGKVLMLCQVIQSSAPGWCCIQGPTRV